MEELEKFFNHVEFLIDDLRQQNYSARCNLISDDESTKYREYIIGELKILSQLLILDLAEVIVEYLYSFRNPIPMSKLKQDLSQGRIIDNLYHFCYHHTHDGLDLLEGLLKDGTYFSLASPHRSYYITSMMRSFLPSSLLRSGLDWARGKEEANSI